MNYRTNPIEVTTIGEARGLRAELVCRLSTQDFTYRIVDVATGGVLEADTGFEWHWSRVRAAGRRALARRIFGQRRR